MEQKTNAERLISILHRVVDPREAAGTKYPLVEILFLVVSAVMSDCDTWEEIHDFGEAKLDWLRQYLDYERGIPSPDTINRVLGIISPKSLESCLVSWSTEGITLPDGSLLQIDGKTLRRSATSLEQQTPKAEGGRKATHLLHVWSDALGICLAQKEVEGKQNEKSALPGILELLDIKGCIVTLDAIFCNRQVAEAIVSKKADYVLAVKHNHKLLYQGIESCFETHAQDLPSIPLEKVHGRQESRQYQVLDANLLDEQLRKDWPKLRTIVKMVSHRKEAYKAHRTTTRYFVTNLEPQVDKIMSAIRSHWSIENKLHWQLDVTFGEDASRKQQNNVAGNFSVLRKITLHILKNIPGVKKRSVRGRRKNCLMSDDFRKLAMDSFLNQKSND